MSQLDQQTLTAFIIVAIFLVIFYRRKWQGSGWAHGTASWATEADLQKAGMFGSKGLLLGRTRRKGKLLSLPKYHHLSVFAPTGAGKGVSFVIPALLSYRGSVFVFDPKGENYRLTAHHRRAMGQKVIRIDPFQKCGPGGDSFNPLLEIALDDPRLEDEARALAEAIVVRPPDGDKDPHWNNSAVMMLTAMIVATLRSMREEDRNLSTVRELLTDPALFKEAIKRLQAMGDVPARLGNMLAKQTESEKEISGVISTANTHTAFLDSSLVAMAVNTSTFSADVLLEPGSTTIYFILPPDQLDAQRNLLRLATSSFLRHVIRHGVKNGGEVLFLIDEAASLGSLEALSQALQLGRGSGVRLYLFWQTAEQAQAAFKQIPNLVSDNCDAKIYFGVNSLQTAELISKSLGNWTMTVESASSNETWSRQTGSQPHGPSGSCSRSDTRNQSEIARPLLDPAEVMRLPDSLFVALIKGVRPILGRRIKYYADPLFLKAKSSLAWVALVLFGLLLWWYFFNPR